MFPDRLLKTRAACWRPAAAQEFKHRWLIKRIHNLFDPLITRQFKKKGLKSKEAAWKKWHVCFPDAYESVVCCFLLAMFNRPQSEHSEVFIAFKSVIAGVTVPIYTCSVVYYCYYWFYLVLYCIFCLFCSSVLAHSQLQGGWHPTFNWESGSARGFCLVIRQVFPRRCRLSSSSRWEQVATGTRSRPDPAGIWYGAIQIKADLILIRLKSSVFSARSVLKGQIIC